MAQEKVDLGQISRGISLEMRVLTEQIEILAPHPMVWATLEDFGGVSDWAPYMNRSKLVGSKQTGVGTRRIMHHDLGFNFEEMVTHWIDGEGYSFDVYRAPYPMKNVHETWSTQHENGLSTVSTQVNYGMRLGTIGRLLDWALVRFIVRREMRAGLRGLKQYLEREAGKASAVQYAD
jgi:ligand-binding SRPBCC domain-containing protein